MLTGRFAPSPSGQDAPGKRFFRAARVAVGAQPRAGGCCCASRIWTRTAAGRNTPRQLKRDLDWLGLDWDAEQTPQSQPDGGLPRGV